MSAIKKILEVAWHRNGVGGVGFHAVRFTAEIAAQSKEDAELWNTPETPGVSDANFLAIVFDTPGECAVICLDWLPTHGVRFGGNSWRGDRYEQELRQAIETTESSGSFRVGPFGLLTE